MQNRSKVTLESQFGGTFECGVFNIKSNKLTKEQSKEHISVINNSSSRTQFND